MSVFLSDNHAESFAWIARHFDLDTPHTLVLVDAHSDATAAERSEQIREQLRRVPDESDRARRVEAWLSRGRVEAFNWIEPLMPRPLERVLWVPNPAPSPAERLALTREAVEFLDGRLEVEPRSSGSFANRWETLGIEDLAGWKPGLRRVILSIDLDFFSGMPEPETRFGEIWQTAMRWPGLVGVSFAISRPWLKTDAEADALVRMALDAVLRTRGARLVWDTTPDNRPDHSLEARKFAAAGKPVPRWNIAEASPELLSTLAQFRRPHTNPPSGSRAQTNENSRNLLFLETGPNSAPSPVTADSLQPDCDGVWRFPASSPPILRLSVPGDPAATGRVRWYALLPALDAYDLRPESGLGKSFSANPGRWIYLTKTLIAETADFALAPEAWRNRLDPRHHCGRILIAAEYQSGTHWLPCGKIELRAYAGPACSFHAGLSECFGMPYVFGIAMETDARGRTGVDTGWGADCSNFLAHAWRRSGVRIAWGDPARVRSRLALLAENQTPESRFPMKPEWIRRGLAIDFGSHMAALWEDRPPLGLLDASDIMAHHLGGRPELLPLGELARPRPPFAVLAPRSGARCRVAIAGDVVPLGKISDHLEILRKARAGADLLVANLEGVPAPPASAGESRRSPAPPRYDFRFDPATLQQLHTAGIDVVSLANNHAADAGPEAIAAGRRALENAGIGVAGAGADLAEALRPWRRTVSGVRLAVFGACAVDAPAAGPHTPGVLRLPDHAAPLARAIAAARNRGETVIVLVHWGDEFTRTVNADQRRWAFRFTECGASVVAGAGPHVVQPAEMHAGAAILYSLGNAVYPPRLRGAGSGAVFTAVLDESAAVVSSGLRLLAGSR
jgi:hypothetical protein